MAVSLTYYFAVQFYVDCQKLYIYDIIISVLLLVLQAKEVAEQTLGSGLNSVELMQFKATLR